MNRSCWPSLKTGPSFTAAAPLMTKDRFVTLKQLVTWRFLLVIQKSRVGMTSSWSNSPNAFKPVTFCSFSWRLLLLSSMFYIWLVLSQILLFENYLRVHICLLFVSYHFKILFQGLGLAARHRGVPEDWQRLASQHQVLFRGLHLPIVCKIIYWDWRGFVSFLACISSP